MGHYCQRFRNAMLPYILQDRPVIQTLHILRSGLPSKIMQFTPPTTIEMTLDETMEAIMGAEVMAYMVQAALEAQAPEYEDYYRHHSLIAEDDHLLIPVDNAGVRELVYHGGSFIPEEPIPALPIQGIPAQEEDDDMDPVEHLIDSEENLENPPVIIIANDDEEGDEEEEHEEDPEEILFGDDDDDWDADSEVFSDVTIK